MTDVERPEPSSVHQFAADDDAVDDSRRRFRCGKPVEDAVDLGDGFRLSHAATIAGGSTLDTARSTGGAHRTTVVG